MQPFAQTAETIAATARKAQRVALLADYFRSRPLEQAVAAAVFFSPDARSLKKPPISGGSLLWRIAVEVTQTGDAEFSAALACVQQILRPRAAEKRLSVFVSNTLPLPTDLMESIIYGI